MAETSNRVPKQSRLGTAVSLIVLAFAIAIATMLTIFPGQWKSDAHPYDAPQIGDFMGGTFLCSGEYSSMTQNQIAEFSGTWAGGSNAIIKIVEFKDGQPSDDIDGTLFIGVDDYVHGAPGNYAVLNGTMGGKPMQSVVLRVEGISKQQEFGVYAAWFPKGEYALLARWKGDEKNKCGDPLTQYGRP